LSRGPACPDGARRRTKRPPEAECPLSRLGGVAFRQETLGLDCLPVLLEHGLGGMIGLEGLEPCRQLAQRLASQRVDPAVADRGASMTTDPQSNATTTRLEHTYATTLEELWELWTTAAGIESWWAPDGFTVAVEKIDPRPGGDLIYTMTATAPEQIAFMQSAG